MNFIATKKNEKLSQIRQKRAIYHGLRGQWRKSHKAIHSKGEKVDIYQNNNLHKLESKFPFESREEPYPFCKDVPKLEYYNTLQKYQYIKSIIKSLNRDGCAGQDGIDNELTYWIANNDTFGFIKIIAKFCDYCMYNQFPTSIARFLTHSSVHLIGKEKNGIFDADIRPIAVLPSVIRLVDKIIMELHRHQRDELIGPYQIIGQKQASETGKVVMTATQDLQEINQNLVVFNADATNAYNSVLRNVIHSILKEKSKTLANWFSLLYSHDNILTVDSNISLAMSSGVFQGLSTSEIFYSCAKWKVTQNTIAKCKTQTFDKFKVFMHIDYVDDGNTMFECEYLNLYIQNLIDEYEEIGIELNLDKSLMAMKTNNKLIMDKMRKIIQWYGIKFTFDNNYKFMGGFYGTQEFINRKMNDELTKWWYKINDVFAIKHSFIRYNLLQKFYGYNKYIFLLKTMPKSNKWMKQLNTIYQCTIYRAGFSQLSIDSTSTLSHQICMPETCGGFGIRDPQHHQYAAEISALRDIDKKVKKFFCFTSDSYNMEIYQDVGDVVRTVLATPHNDEMFTNDEKLSFELDFEQLYSECKIFLKNQNKGNWFGDDDSLFELWQDKIELALDKHRKSYQSAIDSFNQFIGPNYVFNESEHKSHDQLLELMNKKYHELFIEKSNNIDRARINSLSNGSMYWLNAMYDFEIPRKLTNQQIFVALLLVSGSPIFKQNNLVCRKCNQAMDINGYHCLSCVHTGLMEQRIVSIYNIIAKYMKQAGYNVEKRKETCRNYKRNDNLVRQFQLVVNNWQLDEKGTIGTMSFQLEIGNIFEKSYIANTSSQQLYLANLLQKNLQIDVKYKNRKNIPITGLGLECLGGMSNQFEQLLCTVGRALEDKTVTQSECMQRFRAEIMTELMFWNVKMVESCSHPKNRIKCLNHVRSR